MARIHFALTLICLITLIYYIFSFNKYKELTETEPRPLPYPIDTVEIRKIVQQEIAKYVADQKKHKLNGLLAPYSLAQDNQNKVYGNKDAVFSIIEYSDLECPYCKQYHPTLKELVDMSQGYVNWQYKHLTMQNHDPVAVYQAIAVECAYKLSGNATRWAFINEIFQTTKGNGQGAGTLLNLADKYSINNQDFKTCLTNSNNLKEIMLDVDEAKSLGITSTPTLLIINNKNNKSALLQGIQNPQTILEAFGQLKGS